MIAAALRLLSGPGASARLSVLIFHRVVEHPDPLFPGEVDIAQFDQMMDWVRRWFRVLPLAEAIARLQSGSLPARAAAITFDDGYADNLHNAQPVLQRHGLTATVFVATGFLNGGRMWNDVVIESVRRTPLDMIDLGAIGLGAIAVGGVAEKRAAIARLIPALKYLPADERAERVARVAEASRADLPDDQMLTTSQLRQLAACGIGIGAHTVSHPILARITERQARREIADSRAELEAILGDRVGLFAYPNGKPGEDYLPEHVAMVRELGFDAAVSTAWGAARVGTTPYEIPRFTPWDRTALRFGMRLLSNLVKT